jgi:hypothetical protein
MVMCRRNVRWLVKDATELEVPAGSVDVVFSNWLLMYLADSEVAKLAADALRWVRNVPQQSPDVWIVLECGVWRPGLLRACGLSERAFGTCSQLAATV